MEPWSEVVILIALLVLNGVLSMAEMAIVSAKKNRLQQRAENGEKRAAQALKLAKNPHDFLSMVQVGITLIGILAGVFSGATVAEEIAAALGQIAALEPYSEGIALAIVVVVITYFSLVIGELAPKRLALSNPESVAMAVATRLLPFARITQPINSFLNASTGALIRILGVRQKDEPPVTEEEIRFLIEQGAQTGILEEDEQDMIEGVLRFGDQRILAYMTPRPQVSWLRVDASSEDISRMVQASGHARYPVLDISGEDVVGIVHTKDLLIQTMAGKPIDIQTAIHPPLYVPENTLADELLEQFRERKLHMAVVVDEYGNIQGIVTPTDLLEGIVGELPSSGQQADAGIYQRPDGSWLLDGLLHIDKFKEYYRMETLPGESETQYQTVGGFIMAQLGRVPAVGDQFKWDAYQFEVVDMDGHRVDKVLISRRKNLGAE